MRPVVLVMLGLCSCVEAVDLADVNPSLDVDQYSIRVALGCRRLAYSAEGHANGIEMRMISRGDVDRGSNNGDFQHDETVDTSDICYPAILGFPDGLTRAPEVEIELSDPTATLTAAYPDLLVPRRLELVSTEMIEGRVAITVDLLPRSHRITADGVFIEDGGYSGAPGFDDEMLDNGRHRIVLPAEPDRSQTYLLRTVSLASATRCEGFETCNDARREDWVPLDPAWLAL